MVSMGWLIKIEIKKILCSKCGRVIGEIEEDADITFPTCGECSNPLPEGDDFIYIVSKMKNQ